MCLFVCIFVLISCFEDMKYNEIEAESRRRFIQNQKESMLLKILESLKARKSDDRTARGQKSLRSCVFESELLRLGKIVCINLSVLVKIIHQIRDVVVFKVSFCNKSQLLIIIRITANIILLPEPLYFNPPDKLPY